MKRWISRLLAAALCLALLGGCAASPAANDEQTPAPAAEATETPAAEATAAPTAEPAAEEENGPLTGEEMAQQIQDNMAQSAAENMPEVRTLQSGVQVQRTPSTSDTTVMGNLFYDYMNYNMNFLDADKRGCLACHTSLADVIDNMTEYNHIKMNNSMDIEIGVYSCMACHDWSTGLYDEPMGFGSLMHAIHRASKNAAFEAMGGDCWSCHYATEDDQGLQLWDEVKHEVLRGISSIDASSLDYSFAWDQDYVLQSADDLFALNWFFDPEGILRYAKEEAGLKPDPENDGIYDQWEITVDGEVETPFTMTIAELIETFGTETVPLTLCCGDNVVGAPWIGNFEITGININKLVEYAQPREGVNLIHTLDDRGTDYVFLKEQSEKNGGYLVLEVAGEPLPYHSGYPTQAWFGGAAAWSNTKEVRRITVTTEDITSPDFPAWAFNTGFYVDGVSHFQSGIAAFNLHEGQILPAGQPHTFEGYAYGWGDAITAVEFSFDQGATWITCDTPDMNVSNWVHWSLTWNPPAAGAYVITMRSVQADGYKTYHPVEFLVNVQ